MADKLSPVQILPIGVVISAFNLHSIDLTQCTSTPIIRNPPRPAPPQAAWPKVVYFTRAKVLKFDYTFEVITHAHAHFHVNHTFQMSNLPCFPFAFSLQLYVVVSLRPNSLILCLKLTCLSPIPLFILLTCYRSHHLLFPASPLRLIRPTTSPRYTFSFSLFLSFSFSL